MTAPVEIKKPLKIYRGDTLSRTYTVGVLDEDTEIVTPVDLRPFGNVWAAQLRAKEDAPDGIDLTVDLDDLEHGKITIKLDSVSAENVPSKGFWDVQATDTSVTPHVVRTIMRGEFVLIKDVTRP